MTDTDRKPVCPECAGTAIDTDTELATALCQDCGAVVDELSVTESDVSKKETTETELDEDDAESSLTVDWENQFNPKDASDQQLVNALTQMDHIASELEIEPAVRIRIAEMLTQAWEERITLGRCWDSVIGACVFAGCQDVGVPRPLRVVAELTGVGSSQLFDVVRTMTTQLNLELNTTKPCEYLPYLQEQTRVNDSVITNAQQLLSTDHDEGGDPAGKAIAAIYVAADDPQFTYVEAAAITGLTKETIWRKAEALRKIT